MKMIASIGERLAAKLANANDNAFKMRRLFKMYDEAGSGYIHLDDLRMMMESVGVQLDDDSLLALYHVYDKGCTGYLKYEELMRVLLDDDYFALYTGANDVTQASADLETVKKMVATIKGKFKTSVDELAKVLRCLDAKQTGARGGLFVTAWRLQLCGCGRLAERRVACRVPGAKGLSGGVRGARGDAERRGGGVRAEPRHHGRRGQHQVGRLHQPLLSAVHVAWVALAGGGGIVIWFSGLSAGRHMPRRCMQAVGNVGFDARRLTPGLARALEHFVS